MKLIDAPIGIFRFDGELVLKTEYCSENKLSGKYIPDCYIVRTGEYFFGGAKTANELNNLDVEPIDFAELLPTVTDTISRQAAIDACGGYLVPANIIKQLPSTQPEPHWIPVTEATPTEDDDYWATFEAETGRFVDWASWYQGRWVVWIDGSPAPLSNVIAWCKPMEPYKGVTK